MVRRSARRPSQNLHPEQLDRSGGASSGCRSASQPRGIRSPKARKRAPAVLALEVAIDKALSSPLDTTQPATCVTTGHDPRPQPAFDKRHLAPPSAARWCNRHGTRRRFRNAPHFSENKERAIALLQQAISTSNKKSLMLTDCRAPKKSRTLVIEPDQEQSLPRRSFHALPGRWAALWKRCGDGGADARDNGGVCGRLCKRQWRAQMFRPTERAERNSCRVALIPKHPSIRL